MQPRNSPLYFLITHALHYTTLYRTSLHYTTLHLTHAHTYTHTYIRIHTYTYAYIHTCTYAHITIRWDDGSVNAYRFSPTARDIVPSRSVDMPVPRAPWPGSPIIIAIADTPMIFTHTPVDEWAARAWSFEFLRTHMNATLRRVKVAPKAKGRECLNGEGEREGGREGCVTPTSSLLLLIFLALPLFRSLFRSLSLSLSFIFIFPRLLEFILLFTADSDLPVTEFHYFHSAPMETVPAFVEDARMHAYSRMNMSFSEFLAATGIIDSTR